MKRYERGDSATFYFVIDTERSNVVGYSDIKDLVDFYMQFHNCKRFKLKKLSDTIDRIIPIIEENNNDEIKLYNITTRDPKNHKKSKIIQIPATGTEINFINEETADLMSSRIAYSEINLLIRYLKKKYQRALKDIFLVDCISKIIYSKNSYVLSNIEYDQLIILLRSFHENFGK